MTTITTTTIINNTIGVINYGQWASAFEILKKIEEALEKVDAIYIAEYCRKNNRLKVPIFSGINVIDEESGRRSETPKEAFTRAIKKFEREKNPGGWDKEFLHYLSDEVLGKWEEYCSVQTGKSGGRYVSIRDNKTNDLFKHFLEKKVKSSFCQFVESLDDIPYCNEYKILYLGGRMEGGYDHSWVEKFILKSKKGKLEKAEKIQDRIKKRKTDLIETIKRSEEQNQKDLELIERLEKEASET